MFKFKLPGQYRREGPSWDSQLSNSLDLCLNLFSAHFAFWLGQLIYLYTHMLKIGCDLFFFPVDWKQWTWEFAALFLLLYFLYLLSFLGGDVLWCGVFAGLSAPQCSFFQALMNIVVNHKGIFILRSRVQGYCRQGFAKVNLFSQ